MELRGGVSNTIADYLRAAAQPYLHPALVSPETMNAILETANPLPGGLTEFFGFECPLGSEEGKADFLISARPSTGGRDVLVSRKPGRELPARFREDPIWARIFNFAAAWSDPASPLCDQVQNLWLEFDIDGKPPSIPPPSVFMGSGALCAGTADGRWLTGIAIPLLRGREEEPEVVKQIDWCLKALPAGSCIFQVGIMLARQAKPVRLCVRGVPADGLADHAAGCGWKGPAGELRSLVKLLAGISERIDLDMDAGETILPKLGLECYPARGKAELRLLLDGLVSQGLCTPRKAGALAGWTGIATERTSREVWPGELLQMSDLLGGRSFSAFYRWVHHVKVNFEPGLPLQAKAYLGVQHVWLDPARLQVSITGRQPERMENICRGNC